VAPAPAASPKIADVTSGQPGPPEGTHPDAGRMTLASLPVPPGATKEEVALGERIYHDEVDGGTCAGCHGLDARGSPQAPSLIDGKWLQNDGSLARITRTITDGVPKPKNYSHAAARRRAVVRLRCRRRRCLCLGDQPPRREVVAACASEHTASSGRPGKTDSVHAL
jgi:mono/diheme cytochrome c family protein